jgi:FkbM family methyltransferase
MEKNNTMSDIFGINILKTILSEVNVVIDGGAEEGRFTKEILNAYPCTVHAFEPQLESFAVLKSNFKDDKRVIVNNMALGERNGKAILRCNAMNCTSSLLDWENEQSPQTGLQEVQVITLDTYCKESIDLFKMDLQGYELNALRGAEETLKHTKVVMSELLYIPLYVGQAYASEVESFLFQRGFRLVSYNNANVVNGKITWQDGIYIKP